MPPENSNVDNADLERAIAEVEQSLFSLKERYAQVQRDKQRKVELQQERSELKAQNRDSSEIKAQLQLIQKELDAIEINLESSLFQWRRLWEPFWQIVRFGGLGVILGWVLKSCAG
ncbi:hypothetical protein IQ249_18265 [Lusitaniella coriacea LEGE 07157]|uniref:DUF2203 domain-containing protein n=1 Tax=Lusitaniella coriacea LEGE 07157 TaxID=945747 RepID=A0A8J7DYX9_9CYAN|nr:hypothetical protein [Lusitaniella coriacea]MBE9117848.1 hypothetical protein [Lusitaniella coriacea LEGE 07157]